MNNPRKSQRGGSNGVKPLTEGHVRKGGLNQDTTEPFERPPPPKPMRLGPTRAVATKTAPTQGTPSRI